MARVTVVEPASGAEVELDETHPMAEKWAKAEAKKAAPRRSTKADDDK